MTPRRDLKTRISCLSALLGAIFLFSANAHAECADAESYREQMKKYQDMRDADGVSAENKKIAEDQVKYYSDKMASALRYCEEKERDEKRKADKIAKDKADCEKRESEQKIKGVYSWDDKRNRCINKAELAGSKALPDSDDCSAASVFTDLKGGNCKKAANTVRDVRARTSALTDATTAATTAYSGLQATGATGAQDDAQTRQANIMKTLAISKFATGALGLTAAMQLRSAASGAEQASSTISSAQKNIAAACKDSTDDQVCFYQNAPKYGVSPDQQSYASFERMKRGATQSQDQADAANALAKTSMITGAADMLVGLQAMKAAQMARNNAQQMAPPPMFVAPPPPGQTRFGDGGRSGGAPSLDGSATPPPTDYGNPSANNGDTFGSQNNGPINGSLVPGRMGTPNIGKPAASGVSGGGGGGGVGGGGLRGGGGSQKGSTARRGGTAVGEYTLGAGGPKAPGASAEKNDASNPMADMLAKLFPQDPQGKPVVDTRQIASGGAFENVEGIEQGEAVTAADLSLFEQVSAKYRQLNGSGRF